MHSRNNPLKNIPPNAFTIFQTSREVFKKDLADLPVRYPVGKITYISHSLTEPFVQFSDEHYSRFVRFDLQTGDAVLTAIEADTSAFLIIEYNGSWFNFRRPEELLTFCTYCKIRARRGGPVILLTAFMERYLLQLKEEADNFIQLSALELKGKRLEMKEQTRLDEIRMQSPVPGVCEKMYGQTKLIV